MIGLQSMSHRSAARQAGATCTAGWLPDGRNMRTEYRRLSVPPCNLPLPGRSGARGPHTWRWWRNANAFGTRRYDHPM